MQMQWASRRIGEKCIKIIWIKRKNVPCWLLNLKKPFVVDIYFRSAHDDIFLNLYPRSTILVYYYTCSRKRTICTHTHTHTYTHSITHTHTYIHIHVCKKIEFWFRIDLEQLALPRLRERNENASREKEKPLEHLGEDRERKFRG